MKINIKPSDCKFIVDEEKRKVVCIIDNTQELVFDFLNYPLALNNTIRLTSKVVNTLILPNRFTGIATCAPEDIWDPEVGKAIAFSRAKYKLNTSFFKRANFLVNEIDREVGKLVESFNDYGSCLTRNNQKREKWITDKVGNDVFLGERKENEIEE